MYILCILGNRGIALMILPTCIATAYASLLQYVAL